MTSDETLTPQRVGPAVSLPSNGDDEGAGPQDSDTNQQRRSLLNSNLFVKVVALVVLLVGWQVASWIMGEFLLPGPVAVSERLVQVVLEEDFVRHMSATLYRVRHRPNTQPDLGDCRRGANGALTAVRALL